MKQKLFLVMHKLTGRKKEVTAAWIEAVKGHDSFADYEVIGPINEQKSIIIEDIPTIYIPANSNKTEIEDAVIASDDNNSLPTEVEKEAIKPKAKKGRKPKQK